MKFSVVIPCHDRLEYLQEAVYTVLKQDWADWELVIFDNASGNNLAHYVKELSDPRIKYDRSDEFLPVTDSWNRAIDMATGDYVVFLGDDDGLTPHYFSRLAPIIKKFENPEVVYSTYYQFMHPGVYPSAPGGYVAEIKYAFFFQDQTEPFLLSPDQRFKAVKGSVHLRRNFSFNIQAFVFSQPFLSQLKKEGPFFRSCFPDYYIANIALAKSESLLVIPKAMTIAGVSKASVGYALFNGLEDRFSKILNMKLTSDPLYKDVKRFFLPGPIYNTHYVMTMMYVVRHIPSPHSLKVAFSRYRRLQIYNILSISQKENLKSFSCWNQLNILEKLWITAFRLLLKLGTKNRFWSRIVAFYIRKKVEMHPFRATTRICNENTYKQLIEVFDALQINTIV